MRAALAAVLLAPLLALQPAPASRPQARGLDVYWIDVEGGAATLIVTPAGESVLVDSGWPEARDAERIRQVATGPAGLDRIDHLVTTHWHRDHVGGIAELAKRIPVGRFYDHGFPEGSPSDIQPELKDAYLRVTGGRSTVLRPGDVLALRQAPGPRVAARVLTSGGAVGGESPGAPQVRACPARPEHPSRPEDDSDNYRSVGLLVSFGTFELLDLGDLTWNVEHKLVCPRNLVGPVDVYQVTHHGLDQSNNPDLVRAVRPAVAVMNNGPRKGGSPSVYRTLAGIPGLQDVFQLHRNVATGPGDNASPDHVANDDEACSGNWIHLGVDPDARHYTVEIPAKQTRRRYTAR